MQKVINALQANGFEVNNRGYVFKYSNKTRTKEVAGQVNNAGVYFYAQNVSPFKQGQNFYKNIVGSGNASTFTPYKPTIIEAEVNHNFSFSDYKETTQQKNQFELFLKAFHQKQFSKPLENNLYDIRGVKSGYLEDATLFPYINFDNEFQTAKIVKYNSITGKRIKKKYSNNWFHAYKPIKEELGLKDKIRKSGNCFFGEHLLAFNNKPVVIVEAEKTAIILSLFYKEIIFLATGGLGNLKTLDHYFLANRNVHLFPDNNASEWFKIADERGWFCSDVLEVYGSNGNDIIDYLETRETSEESNNIFLKVHEQLWNINAGTFDTSEIQCYTLNLNTKKNTSYNYCLPNLREIGLNYYWDNSKGEYFKGRNFKIYNDKFQYLNANIDFNKVKKDEAGNYQMDSKTFLKRLEKCFRITKHLNSNKEYKKLFAEVLLYLNINSNYTFNIDYVTRVLIPLWDNDNNNVLRYIKSRNWCFVGGEGIPKEEFRKELANDKRLSRTNSHLKKLKPLLEKGEFIHSSDVDLHRESDDVFVWGLIKQYNKEVIGSTTYRNYKSKLKISEYLNWCIDYHNVLNPKNELYIKLCSTYYSGNISCTKRCTTFKLPSHSTIFDNTGVHRKLIKEYFTFQPNKDLLIDIKELVNYYINNSQDFSFNRESKYLEAVPNKTIEEIRNLSIKQISISPEEAFSDELDLSNSVLNCTIDEAFNKPEGFLLTWFKFNYPDLTFEELLDKIAEYNRPKSLAS